MRIKLILIMLLTACLVQAQQRKPLKGRVVATSIAMPDRVLVNLNSQSETKTDSLGNFSINAAVSDTIVVQTTNPYTGKIIIREKDFNQFLVIDLGSYELEEVVIDKYESINPEDLGIVKQGKKQYTPAEKKLQTAGEIKSVFDVLSILGGGKSLDAVINSITGKTKRLKKELVTEGKETTIDKIYGIYTEQEMQAKLGIAEEYTGGFVFYAVEDPALVAALKENNEDKAKFILSNLAVKYREILLENEKQ